MTSGAEASLNIKLLPKVGHLPPLQQEPAARRATELTADALRARAARDPSWSLQAWARAVGWRRLPGMALSHSRFGPTPCPSLGCALRPSLLCTPAGTLRRVEARPSSLGLPLREAYIGLPAVLTQAELRRASFEPRSAALATQPASLSELHVAALYLGFGLRSHPDLCWLASAALCAELPYGWGVATTPGGDPYYYNPALVVAQWEHPTHAYLRGLAMVIAGSGRESSAG